MSTLHEEERLKYWAQKTLHKQRCIARQHSPIFAIIFGNVKVDMVDNFK
jgi:hypothetical protein